MADATEEPGGSPEAGRQPLGDFTTTARTIPLGLTLEDMLKARVKHLEDERRRERVLPLRTMIPFARFVAGAPRPPPPATRESGGERPRAAGQAAAPGGEPGPAA